MQAQDYVLVDLIGKKEHIFYVPLYQRKYTWDVNKQINQFWDDLYFFYKEEPSSDFFFGSIIIKKNADLNSKHILVDGQQRITTTLLLISALVHCSKKQRELDEYITLSGYLQSREEKFKLERINDQEIIKKILKGNIPSLTEEDKKSSYYKVFEFFCKKINKHNDDNDVFISEFTTKALQKIKVATINLNENEDEYCIFESINSKGKNLTTADLIKNFIVMKLSDDSEVLNKFENNFLHFFDSFDRKEESLVDFYRQILAIETGELYPKKGTAMYFKFKNKFKDINDIFELKDKLHNLIEKLIIDKEIYCYILNTKWKFYLYPLFDSNVNNFYAIIHTIIKHNSEIKNGKILLTNASNVEWATKYIASLIVGRTLVKFGRVEGNRTYAKMAHELNKEIIETKDFKKSFQTKVIDFLEKDNKSNYRMPSKKEIFNIDAKRDLYTDLRANLKSILLAIESKLSSKEFDKKYKDEINIEHIFPQSSQEWEEICKQSNISYQIKFEDIKEWLNTIGNLSILDKSDNSRLSNKFFIEKKKILDDKSYLKINKMIYEYNKWGVEQIKDRAKKILKEIENIWFIE